MKQDAESAGHHEILKIGTFVRYIFADDDHGVIARIIQTILAKETQYEVYFFKDGKQDICYKRELEVINEQD